MEFIHSMRNMLSSFKVSHHISIHLSFYVLSNERSVNAEIARNQWIVLLRNPQFTAESRLEKHTLMDTFSNNCALCVMLYTVLCCVCVMSCYELCCAVFVCDVIYCTGCEMSNTDQYCSALVCCHTPCCVCVQYYRAVRDMICCTVLFSYVMSCIVQYRAALCCVRSVSTA